MQRNFGQSVLIWLCIILTSQAFTTITRHSAAPSSKKKSCFLLENSRHRENPILKIDSVTTSPKLRREVDSKSNDYRKRKKKVWDNAWVPNGERREKVKKLIREMQKEHLKNFRKLLNCEDDNINKKKKANYNEKLFLQEGLDVLVQWAQLGEGAKCENAAQDLLMCVPIKKLEDYEFHIKVYRRVLHAYYNQYERATWNGRYKKPKFKLSVQELRMGQEVLQTADTIIQRMEELSREYVAKSKTTRNPQKTLLDAGDYAPLILACNHVAKPVPALSALRRLTDLFEQSEQMERLAPAPNLYIAVMKAIFNSADEEWADQMGDKFSKTDIVDTLCRECIKRARNFPILVGPASSMLELYNVAFDAWSKVLPPRSKRERSFDFFDGGEEVNQVATKVTELWKMMQEDNVIPNSKTYTSLIYAYIKTYRLEEAYLMVERLSELLLKEGGEQTKLERVDSRALRTLAKSLSWSILSIEEKEGELDSSKKRSETAERVESIIQFLWDLTEAGYEGVTPTVFLYTTAVNAWADAESTESSMRAEKLVDDLKSRVQQNIPGSNLAPDICLYNALIKAIAKNPNLSRAADKAGRILKSLEKPDSTIKPNLDTYNALIQACITSSNGIERAEQTLEKMILTGDPMPNETTFRLIINALLEVPGATGRAENWLDRMEERFLSKSDLYERIVLSWCNESGKATRARKMLERMEQLFYESGISSLRPARSCYNAVIEALEGQGETSDSVKNSRDEMYGNSIESTQLASNNQVFALLDDIDVDFTDGITPVGNTINFNKAISLIAESGNIWAGSRAEDILTYMLELTFKRKNTNAIPNIITFNSVIAAWAKSDHALAGERAAGVLKKLEDLHDMGLLEDVQPNRATYNTLMNVYAKAKDTKDSAQRAQECMNKLGDLYDKTRDEMYRPDVISYSTLLSAWARNGQSDSAEKTEALLFKMIEDNKVDRENNPQPNIICFNEVLYAWARSCHPDAIPRMRMIFQLMHDMDYSGQASVMPDTQSFNILLLAFANSARTDSPIQALEVLEEMEKMSINFGKPDVVSYNTVISAFLKKGDVEAAMKILDNILARDDLKFNSHFFSSLIFSLSESGALDAPMVAESIVNNIIDTQEYSVDATILNSLIKCWGRGDIDEGPERAMDILQGIVDGKYGQATPDVVTFTSVIDIWAKSGQECAVRRAEEVMALMKATPGISPNTQTYTAFIQTVGRSNLSNKARKAKEILQLMKDDFSNGNRDAKPSLYTYNAVLNAAEFTFGKEIYLEEAFAVACEVFDEIRSTMKPDHVTYGTFMGIIAQLMPKSGIRNDMIQLVFRRCCMDGQLAPLVIKKFKQAATRQQFFDLMGGEPEDDLPNNWTCNIRRIRL
mmetsp:Transcript_31939/g.48278  ORF Transcript_31939/g.48278 Transcript_31939/m.48278 type:complete len:1368 (-) Transcript_31939:316-4419(-)